MTILIYTKDPLIMMCGPRITVRLLLFLQAFKDNQLLMKTNLYTDATNKERIQTLGRDKYSVHIIIRCCSQLLQLLPLIGYHYYHFIIIIVLMFKSAQIHT